MAGKKPNCFPYELFVESKVVEYFRGRGFDVKTNVKIADIRRLNLSTCLHLIDIHVMKDDEEWRIECKGETANISVDFNTGLGQILKRMDSDAPIYAVAMPYTDKYRDKVKQVPDLVRGKLKLRWIWVKKDGTVEIDDT